MAVKEVAFAFACWLYFASATFCINKDDCGLLETKIAFVDRRATIATTITSVELENAVGVATVRRNARMASVEKTATLARTVGSVILMSVAIRMTPVSWFVLIASLAQPLQVLSSAVWLSPPL